MVIFNNQTVSRIEGAANTLLQRVTDCQFPSCLLFLMTISRCVLSDRILLVSPAVKAKTQRLQTSERRPVLRPSQY
jgi:hypothetical protein